MDSWVNNGVAMSSVDNSYNGGSYSSRKCPSPQSSALGDGEESDDKECEEDSCWSEGGTNDISSEGSVSSLNPDLNWTEAVRLMSENKWPNGQNDKPDPIPPGIEPFLNGKEKSDNGYMQNMEPEVNDRLLELSQEERSAGSTEQSGGNYYCKLPADKRQGSKLPKRATDRSQAVPTKCSNRNYTNNELKATPSDGSSGRSKHSSHSRKTSLTSPLV